MWNYNDRLYNASNNSLSKYITTNNLNENINRFLNLNLKGGRNSFDNFIYSLQNVFIQFEEKLVIRHIDDTKIKILNFYVTKINEDRNFNGPYNDEQIGEIDLEHAPYDSESDEDGEFSEEYLENEEK